MVPRGWAASVDGVADAHVDTPSAKIPEGLLDRSRPKASGVVRLPPHVVWSPPWEYDLGTASSAAAPMSG